MSERPSVEEAAARAVEAWYWAPSDLDCAACEAIRNAPAMSNVGLVCLWAAVECDPCPGCHAMMTELSALADPAGALALAVGREGRLIQ